MTNDSLRELAENIYEKVNGDFPSLNNRSVRIWEIEEALRQVDEKARREGFEKGVKDSAEIAEKHKHGDYCTLERCGGYSGTPTTCDLSVLYEIGEKILALLPTPGEGKEK